MMDLNYMGVVHATRAVVPGMIARRSGHVIAVASTLSLMGASGLRVCFVLCLFPSVFRACTAQKQPKNATFTDTIKHTGAIGYCAYAPSKFAVRGFMESLRQELQGTGVRASICYPPDMDTPGYAREGLTKVRVRAFCG
jgi:3-dehydrosphinganine reductase